MHVALVQRIFVINGAWLIILNMLYSCRVALKMASVRFIELKCPISYYEVKK